MDTAQFEFEFKNEQVKCERRRKRASPQVGVESIRNTDQRVLRLMSLEFSMEGSFRAALSLRFLWRSVRCGALLVGSAHLTPGRRHKEERQRLTLRLEFCECLCVGGTNVGFHRSALFGVCVSLFLLSSSFFLSSSSFFLLSSVFGLALLHRMQSEEDSPHGTVAVDGKFRKSSRRKIPGVSLVRTFSNA